MSWADQPDWYRWIAEAVCTDSELEALRLDAAGISLRGIAFAQHVSRTTAKDRLRRAHQKIGQHPDCPKEAS